MDRFIEEGFELLGETPPEGVFVRYEWTGSGESLYGDAAARRLEDVVRIRSNFLILEHELAHAVHLEAWRYSAAFLQEGFATLLDPYRPVDIGLWRDGADLDTVLEARNLTPLEYHDAWFLVSQIVSDHGMAGLEDLWHEVPYGATAAEVRAAYENLFGRPIDTLIEPWDLDGKDMTRYGCTFALCTGQPVAWDDAVWSASGPIGCEDDPFAVGPYTSGFQPVSPVWRDYVLDPEGQAYDSDPANEGVPVNVHGCGLTCSSSPYDVGQGTAPEEPWREDRRRRIQIHAELEDLPTDSPAVIRYHRG